MSPAHRPAAPFLPILILTSIWAQSPVAYAAGCKFHVATLGHPPTCTAVDPSNRCSPLTDGVGSTGVCAVSGNEACSCNGGSFEVRASPSQLAITPGQTGTATISIISKGNFRDPVQLSTSSLPSGVTAKINPASTSTKSSIVFNVGTGAITGTSTVTITGVFGEVSATAPVSLVISSTNQPPPPALSGFIELHAHPLANIGFGGKLLYGGVDVGAPLPADPNCQQKVAATSEEQALGHDGSVHGGWNLFNNTCGDLIREQVIHNYQSQNGAADPPGDATGYPDFTSWPVWNDIAHQKMWVEWIRRAYQGGLRVMVALAVNNKTLADMVSGPGDGPDDDMASGDLQIAAIIQFVGRHPDFMEIAYSSSDVQRIVLANKMAVVVGVELDHIGNLGAGYWGYDSTAGIPVLRFYQNPVALSDVVNEIHRLYGLGVRYIFPIHLLDNPLGTTAAYKPLFDLSNVRESGHAWDLVCSDPSDGITWSFQAPDSAEIFAAQLAKLGIAFQVGGLTCPAGTGPRNGGNSHLGLTPIGFGAVEEMMRLGMLIDVDHMSQFAADDTLNIGEHEGGYPLMSGHNGLRDFPSSDSQSERSLTAAQYKCIGKNHGMAGVGSDGVVSGDWLAMYYHVIAAMGGGSIAAGFGTDTNGAAKGMPPRCGYAPSNAYLSCIQGCKCPGPCGDYVGGCTQCRTNCAQGCQARYPDTYQCSGGTQKLVQYSSTFPKSVDGNRSWDVNLDGVVHYGMLWDFLQDLSLLPNPDPSLAGSMSGSDAVANLMKGAQFFFDTWQRAERLSSKIVTWQGTTSGTPACNP